MLSSSLTLASLVASSLARESYLYDTHSLHKRDGGSHHHSPAPAPSSSYDAPAASYSAPSYSAPAPSYGAPEPSYSAPAPSYSVPTDNYASPDTGYGAPAASYGAPEPAYSTPSYAAEGGGIDLTSILIPLLALLGLSLLFPTYVSLTSVRRRREAADGKEGTTIHITLSDRTDSNTQRTQPT